MNEGSWHYCVNTTDVCSGGLCGDRWHYYVNTTVVCGLRIEAVDTIVSSPLTCFVVDYVWRQMTLLCQHHCYIWTAVDTSSSSVSLLGLCYSIFFFPCSFLYIIVYPFVPFILTIVLYVHLPITVCIYPFGICKTVLSPYHCTQYFCVSMRLLEYHTLACSVYYLLNLFKM